MSARAVVVGGGLAGLTAAAALAERGWRVVLCESRPRLGGRASSFVDGATGQAIDNCQHVAMGCCTSFLAFCQRMGVEHLFRRETSLTFLGPDGALCTTRASGWPAPLHLAGLLRNLPGLSLGDRWAIARGVLALAREPLRDPPEAFADWLTRRRQPKRARTLFWDAILVSALSETSERIDVRYARQVLVDGFLAHPRAADLLVPTVPLDDIFGGPVRERLQTLGVEIRLKSGVDALRIEGDRASAVVLRTGESLPADEFVLALPWDRIPAMLPAALRRDPAFEGCLRLEAAPISSVHLWFDRPVTELRSVVLLGRTSQWLFRRDAPPEESRSFAAARSSPSNRGPSPADAGQTASGAGAAEASAYYQVVISASRNQAARPAAEIVAEVHQEIQEAFPHERDAVLRHARVVTEHKAVFSPVPGVDAWRPLQQSPVANLQLAGDWTATGWPATMEGAVRSGCLAVENILLRQARPETLTAPPLSPGWLARWLLRAR